MVKDLMLKRLFFVMTHKELENEEVLDTVLEKEHLKEPNMYQVVLINDDFTPMDFVVNVLHGIFNMSEQKAIKVMLDIHQKGKGICGVYTKEIAEAKADKTMRIAQKEEHPLLCQIEPVSLDNNNHHSLGM